ncbi:MAG: protein-L-isoaspartate(D-aspartate) O-methyltransferase [Candidatus Omnitrophota bacterium]|nr:MAG: protein-L-isoaspartate(D-aspartate) O-methyltransferase [Candidatus Omnitrophota bacterium]
MVQKQLIPRGITDKRVLEAFTKVPRHKFVPGRCIEEAYGDYPVSIGEGQTISQPYMVALMTQCLEVKENDKVLEIGTGSGYQAAILAELADKVYTTERISGLSKNAQGVLQELGYTNIKLKVRDGSLGWEEFAPYDGIIVTCAAPSAPEPLKKQLKENGRLVIPIGGSFSQTLSVVKKRKGGFSEEDICGCVFVPLIGKYGCKQ